MGKWSRRGFIATGVLAGGALAIGVALRPGHRAPKVAQMMTSGDEQMLNVWVKLSPDDSITVVVPHAEMGQGISTSLPMMLADEMDANWDFVDVETAPAHEEYANYALGRGFLMGPGRVPELLVGTVNGALIKLTQVMNLQITGGSSSVRATGIHGMRTAGAAARIVLLQAAADRLDVPVSELSAANSVITHSASGRTLRYGELAAAAAAIVPPEQPRLKSPHEFTVMGQSKPRLDVPAKVDGTAEFGLDGTVPGMKYAAVLGSPVFGGTVSNLDSAAAAAMPGVRGIVNLDNAVAVVADGYWQAKKALASVKVDFNTNGSAGVSSESIFSEFSSALDNLDGSGGEADVSEGDTIAAIAGAKDAGHSVIAAEYRVPFLAHAPMEPMNATAWLHDGKLEIWTSSQNPLGARAEAAEAANLEPDAVTVHPSFLGGGFGRRATNDYVVQAVRTAMAVGTPVKLIWSREEDVRQDRYRPASISRFRGVLDGDGQPVAWRNGYVHKDEPYEAPTIPYAVPNQLIEYVDVEHHVPLGPWRSVAHSQHGFFTESFVDEMAVAAGKDPFEYRRDLLANQPRHRAVLELAAKQAGWGGALPKGSGRGIALQASFGSIVAQVVECHVGADGKVAIDRIVCAADVGFAVNPDGLVQQMESGIIYGLTAALYGDIEIADGAVVQSNFHDYEMLRMREVPRIETHILDSGAELGGAGEPGTPGIAAALTNAIHAATGTRIRQLPVKHYDLRSGPQERA